jgi:hypothetical protein
LIPELKEKTERIKGKSSRYNVGCYPIKKGKYHHPTQNSTSSTVPGMVGVTKNLIENLRLFTENFFKNF